MIDLNLFFFLTQQSGWHIISPQEHFTGYKPPIWPLLSVMLHCYCGLILSTRSHFFPCTSTCSLFFRAWKENYREISMWTDRNKETQREAVRDWDRGVKPIRNGWKEQRQEIRCHFTAEHHQIWSRFLHSIAKMGTRQSGIFFFFLHLSCFVS